MNKLVKSVPNTLTLFNAMSGFLSIVATASGDYQLAVIWIFAAAFFDFVDGAAARLLKVQSAVGKDLDSLSDVVSFGVAPGFIIFNLIASSAITDLHWLKYSALLIPALSVLRLAKFNHDARQSDRFFGLPVPANALFLSAIALVVSGAYPEPLIVLFQHPITLSVSATIGSLLLVSDIPLFSLKFKNLTWRDNWVRYSFLLLSAVSLALFQAAALLGIIPFYIVISLLIKLFSKND